MTFIPDEEINLFEEEQDLLNTKSYVNTLEKIVRDSPTPMTIGLIGGWGTGKSSILKTLIFNFKNNNKIRIIKYDAWKYSDDSFRRTFLLELSKELKNDLPEKQEEIEQKIYQDKYVEHFQVYHFNRWMITIFLLSITIIFGLFLGVNIFMSSKLSKLDSNNPELSNIISSIINSILSIIIIIFSNIIIQLKATDQQHRAFSPEQFETMFDDIIKELNEKKIERIIIAIDNIDRCKEDVVLNILATIKTFLEKEGVIFIIPLDLDQLLKYLKSQNYDTHQYLNKIFDIEIFIRKFSNFDLFDYARKLNQKYQMGFNDTVLSMISQEFSENPRDIIQFMNELKAELTLAKTKEEIGEIPPETVSNNMLALTKLLIIRKQIPQLYRIISKDFTIFNELNNLRYKKIEEPSFSSEVNINYNSIRETYVLDLGEKRKGEQIFLNQKQYQFLLRTSNISASDVSLLILNQYSFRDYPGEIIKAILSQDWDLLKSKIYQSETKLSTLVDIIEKKINEDIFQRELYYTSGYNLFSLILKIFFDPEYGKEFRELIINRPLSDDLIVVFKSFLPQKFSIKELIKEFRTQILNSDPEKALEFANFFYSRKNADIFIDLIISMLAENIYYLKEEASSNSISQNKQRILFWINSFFETFKGDNLIFEKFSKLDFAVTILFPEITDLIDKHANNKNLCYLVNFEEPSFLEFIEPIQLDYNKYNTIKRMRIIEFIASQCDCKKIPSFSKLESKISRFINQIQEKTIFDIKHAIYWLHQAAVLKSKNCYSSDLYTFINNLWERYFSILKKLPLKEDTKQQLEEYSKSVKLIFNNFNMSQKIELLNKLLESLDRTLDSKLSDEFIEIIFNLTYDLITTNKIEDSQFINNYFDFIVNNLLLNKDQNSDQYKDILNKTKKLISVYQKMVANELINKIEEL